MDQKLTHWRNYLWEHIPLARALKIEITRSETTLILTSPQSANHNHQGNAFAGSIATMASLSGWLLINLHCAEKQLYIDCVVAQSTIYYRRPLRGDITARVPTPDSSQWQPFIQSLKSSGRARHSLTIEIAETPQGESKATAENHYVAKLLEKPLAGLP